MRDVVFPDHDFDIDAEIIWAAQDLNHPSNRVAAAFGKLENFRVDNHAVQILGRLDYNRRHAHAIAIHRSGRHFHAGGNLDPLANLLVVRFHKIPAFANPKLAHHGLVRAAQHLDDLAVGAAVLLNSRDTHYHAIAMHGGLRGLARDVDVAAQPFDGMIGDQESVAVAMHIQAADRIFPAETGDHKMPGADFDELAAIDQAIESLLQLVARC